MNKPKCTPKFQSSDGKLFDTCEECEAYENQPAVWVVTRTVALFTYTRPAMRKVFLRKEDADRYIESQISRDYFYNVARFEIDIDLDGVSKCYTDSNDELAEKERARIATNEERKSIWETIKSILK